jgi:hypothetical protein
MYRISAYVRNIAILNARDFNCDEAAKETESYGSTVLIRKFYSIRNYIRYIDQYLDRPRYIYYIPSKIDESYEEVVFIDLLRNRQVLLSKRIFLSFQLMKYNNLPLLCLFLHWNSNLSISDVQSLELKPGELLSCIRNYIRCIKRVEITQKIEKEKR